MNSSLPLLCVALASASLPAQQATLPGALPDDAVLVVEMAEPPAAVAQLLQAVGEVPPRLKEQIGAPAWVALAAGWFAVEGDPVTFARKVAGGGAVLAVVPEGPRLHPVLLLRPEQPEFLERTLARFAAGVPTEVVEGTFVLGPDRGLVGRVAARLRPGGGRQVQADPGPPAPLRGVLDLAALRRTAAGGLQGLRGIGAVARLVLLPLAHAALAAERVTFALTGGERLVLTANAQESVRGDEAGGLLTAAKSHPAVPLPEGGLLSLRLERSLQALLRTPERFLRPDEVLAVQGFLSVADAIDGAHTSFVDDLLGGLAEPFTVHVLPIAPPADGPPPRLQLPGIAIVAPVANPEVEAVLLRAAEAFLLIVNVERAQRGQVTFPARLHRSEHGRGLVAEPLPWRGPGAPPIEQALSPTLWLENGHAVLASTRAAAQAVAAAAQASVEVEPADTLLVRASRWEEVIATSRSVLALGRMLDEGEDHPRATRFFDILATVLGAVREISVTVRCDATTTTFELVFARER